jgi:Ni2+-binding GTPase involved in maturation of urease and hydrogenase
MILVGGFLGAGKTTLLAQAAKRFKGDGKRVGMITNDQAKELVDTGVLKGEGFDVQEVAGGCFCCRFRCFVSVADGIVQETDADVLLGEPVGSCTDLSATVLQPLKEYYSQRYDVAPFTVLADPVRLREALDSGTGGGTGVPPASFPPEVLYIFRKQLEEADIIAINKADTVSPAELAELTAVVAARYGGRPIIAMSALTGEGVNGWMDLINAHEPGGQRITDVDYDTYATGEAALGWLNATAQVRSGASALLGKNPIQADWRKFMLEFMAQVVARCRVKQAQIAHLKILLDCGKTTLVANITDNGQQASIRGEASATAGGGLLTINARVHMAPDDLKEVITQTLNSVAGELKVDVHLQGIESFSPSRPQPEHRYKKIAHQP